MEKFREILPELPDMLITILKGLVVNVEIIILSLILATIYGIWAALCRLSDNKILYYIATSYTTITRGIPDIVFVFVLFFGGQMLLNSFTEYMGWDFINLEPFIAGVLSVGFIFGAYMGETFRGAILSVPKGEIEAAHAYGMTPLQTFLRITFPAMIKHALPGFSNNYLVLVKTTAIVSLIGLHEMTYYGKNFGSATQMPMFFNGIVAILFLAITALSNVGFKWLEQRYTHQEAR